MKKISIILGFILFSNIVSAQIGINTTTPTGTLQIHADKGLPITNLTKDVIVSNEGNISIGGTPTAGAKVQIYTTQTDVKPIRIVDGKQEEGKILGSVDSNGNIGWLTPPDPSFGTLINIIKPAVTKYPSKTRSTLFSWPVPMDGNYLVIIRWWGRADVVATAGSGISSYFYLMQVGGSGAGTKDQVEYYVSYPVQNAPFSLTMPMQGYFQKGTTLQIDLTPATPVEKVYNWIIRQDGATNELNPSIIIIKI